MISTRQFKNGMVIKINNSLYYILEFQHIKPGKGGAFVRIKLKDLKSGAVINKTFRSEEKFEEAYLEEKTLLFSYKIDNFYHFLNEKTYEETIIDNHLLADSRGFLKENGRVTALLCDNKIIHIKVANFVTLKVAYTEPGFKGNTAQGGYKPAKLETGLEVQVPLFINPGDIIKIDTRTIKYMGRA
ncbi:MAG: elongation factor P [Candidatus Omnitrophota bacterium]|nr:elongation factor P [Candidatus Omnitrophota bacterium]